jgi:hypothetical protein
VYNICRSIREFILLISGAEPCRCACLATPRMDTEDRVVPLWDLPGINLPTSFSTDFEPNVETRGHAP